MSDAPKIVLDRLRAVAPGENHPDPDLLTAFAEQTLLSAEREGVVRHLAGCGDCREVVALSIPPSVEAAARPEMIEQAAPALATTGSSRSWFAWPNLRWAAVAASVVVVGSVLLLHEKEVAPTPGAEKLAAQTSAPDLDVDTNSSVPAPLAQSQKDAPAAKRDASGMFAMRAGVREERAPESDRTRTATQSIPPADSPRKDLGTLHRGLVAGADTPTSPPPPTVAGPISRSNEMAEVTAAPAPVNTDAAAAGQTVASQETGVVDGTDKSIQSVPMNGRNIAQLSPIVKAKPAAKEPPAKEEEDRVEAENKIQESAADKKSSYEYSAKSALALQKQSSLRNKGAVARWTLVQGKLQRSFDSGATWQTALQLDHPLLSFGASGSDVWAGGRSGTLFHSTDSGATWNMIQAATKAGVLTADIVSIEVGEAGEIVLTTSSHESWTTVDAGKTWDKK